MQIWRLIDTGSNKGFYNMAVDEAIAIACREGIVPPTLRFYTWAPPCVSIGYFQKVERVLNKGGLDRDNNMTMVRRITGGRAVFHGNDLSYSVVCDTENRLFPDNIKGAYYTIAEALARGLKYLGITTDHLNNIKHRTLNTRQRRTQARGTHAKDGTQARGTQAKHGTQAKACGYFLPYQHSTLCFATTLGHEISVNGRKLIGSAQRRWSKVFLQHGSILITESSSGNGRTSISFSEIIGDEPDTKSIISALSAGFSDTLGINLIAGGLTRYEIDLAERLMEERYSKDSWNVKYA